MNTLLYDYNVCHVRRGDQTFSAGLKPELSFDYEALMYDGVSGQYRWDNADHELTPAQITEIESYIQFIQTDAPTQASVDALMYLAETDWYVVRKAETGKEIPQEVLDKRAAAREAVM